MKMSKRSWKVTQASQACYVLGRWENNIAGSFLIKQSKQGRRPNYIIVKFYNNYIIDNIYIVIKPGTRVVFERRVSDYPTGLSLLQLPLL